MIRYAKERGEIEAAISKIAPKWLNEAKSRTAKFKKAGAYKEKSSIWAQIKPVFMEIQHAKCAYCERSLESGTEGKIEWDVEHFRPKSKVRKWPEQSRFDSLQYKFNLGPASEKGYFLLPYEIGNYLSSCKVCNTIHKLDFFPIASKRRILSTSDPNRLLKEKPFIPYPIGSSDVDPETLVTFQGYLCIPVANSGELRNRALVVIDFFGLNGRDTLMKERAESIAVAWAMLERLQNDPSDNVGMTFHSLATRDSYKHANCVRSFLRVYQSDRNLAKAYVDKAVEYLRGTQTNT